MKREKIKFSEEQMFDLWNGVYYKGKVFEFEGDTYTQVDKINTSDYSDGPSHDYIVKRGSDGKYFKFHVWDAGEHNGYIISDGQEYPMEEVFPEETVIINWK
jgi:hypothetical protein